MADRSQAVIIMALETQERHSGWYVIRPPTGDRQCTESLKSVQQNTPKIRHQIVQFPNTSHQCASQTGQTWFKKLDKCGQLLRVFHTDRQWAVILLYVPDWRMFGKTSRLTCSSCAGGLWPSLSRFANHEKVERIKNEVAKFKCLTQLRNEWMVSVSDSVRPVERFGTSNETWFHRLCFCTYMTISLRVVSSIMYLVQSFQFS